MARPIGTQPPEETCSPSTSPTSRTFPHDHDNTTTISHSRNFPATSFERRHTPRPDKNVHITYTCGRFERSSPHTLPLSRLWAYSAQARIDLSSPAKTAHPGGSLHWTINIQHHAQFAAYERIWAWFLSLPLPPAMQARRLEFDERGDVLSGMEWAGLVLMDVCMEWLKLLRPLDTRKIRGVIWERLKRGNQDRWPLRVEDAHLMWMLYRPRTDASLTADNATMAAKKLFENAQRRERLNRALIATLEASVSEYLDRRGIVAYDSFVRDLRIAAREWGEDNAEFVQALEEKHGRRNYRVVSGGGHGKRDSGVAMNIISERLASSAADEEL